MSEVCFMLLCLNRNLQLFTEKVSLHIGLTNALDSVQRQASFSHRTKEVFIDCSLIETVRQITKRIATSMLVPLIPFCWMLYIRFSSAST